MLSGVPKETLKVLELILGESLLGYRVEKTSEGFRRTTTALFDGVKGDLSKGTNASDRTLIFQNLQDTAFQRTLVSTYLDPVSGATFDLRTDTSLFTGDGTTLRVRLPRPAGETGAARAAQS